jgi:broad specificity phosphatase PhoE
LVPPALCGIRLLARLHLLRHGERLDFVQPEWFDTAILRYDPPLSSQGLAQARSLAASFADKSIDGIFCSPFLRAIQTAAPIAELLNLPLYLEWGLCEWLCGEWTVGMPELNPIDRINYPQIDSSYRSRVLPVYPESIAALNIRSQQTIDILPRDRNLLLVGHKISLCQIATTITGDRSWLEYALGCGEAIEIQTGG